MTQNTLLIKQLEVKDGKLWICVDIDYIPNKLELVSEETLTSRRSQELNEILEEVEKMKVLEVSADPAKLVWKQQCNRRFDEIISLLRTKLENHE